MDKKIAVLIPCYNEELTIKKVINDFRKALPEAQIYVYNNNSTDKTKEYASSISEVIVRDAPLQGKGNVVKQMFEEIDADVYLMVDGDDTYPASYATQIISPVLKGECDMMLGDRLSGNYFNDNKRPFHNFGNWIVRFLINVFFHSNVSDIMTGYRAFSNKFVKTMEIKSQGFEIETELTIFALKNHYKIHSIPILYGERPEGSYSKLNTFKDGIKVITTIFKLKFQH